MIDFFRSSSSTAFGNGKQGDVGRLYGAPRHRGMSSRIDEGSSHYDSHYESFTGNLTRSGEADTFRRGLRVWQK